MSKLLTKHSPLLLVCIGLVLGAGSLPAQSQEHRPLTPGEINGLFMPGGCSVVGEISTLLAHGTGPVHVPCFSNCMSGSYVMMSPSDFLVNLTIDSDLVIVGKAGKSVSHMLPNKSYLYTQTQFAIEDVVKNNPKAPVEPSSTITVGRAGGVLRVNGRMVYAVCPDFLLFRKGQDYLLYLTFIPQTGGYVNNRGGFAFINGKARGLGKGGSVPRGSHWESFVGMSKDLLVKVTRQAASDAAKARPIEKGR